MAEFFQNIWAWICEHANVIAGILTPANLALVMSTIVQLIRYKKALGVNTGTTNALNDSLKEVASLKAAVNEFKARVEDITEQIGALKDDAAQSLTKLNCILDVQQEAYSVSLAKTSTLDAINGIIANGKFTETRSRKAITDEVAELRAKLETLTAAAKQSEAKVKTIAGVADKIEECRYD